MHYDLDCYIVPTLTLIGFSLTPTPRKKDLGVFLDLFWMVEHMNDRDKHKGGNTMESIVVWITMEDFIAAYVINMG